MRTSQCLCLLAVVHGAVAFPAKLVIPEVESAVSSILREYHQYASYAGPTGVVLAKLEASATAAAAANAVTLEPGAATPDAPYWLAQMDHQGVAAFNPDPAYKVFRNVKDYGAKGDGVSDDTAAINMAISDGNRCGPDRCQSSTITPAIVYIPAGTYIVSSSIIDYYYTQIIGNPNSMPVLKTTALFTGFGVIDGDQYQASGFLGFGATNVFYRQIKNLVLDMTNIPGSSAATGIHWPTAQATSLQNVVFKMSSDIGTQHQGLFIESGSGGFMSDLVFFGGLVGANLANQQYTMRNLTFYNSVTAINMLFDWGWTFKSISINNCTVGLNMTSGGRTAQNVGSVTFLDSSMTNVGVGFKTAHDATSQPSTAGSLIIENVFLDNVPIAVQGTNGAIVLAGTTTTRTIAGWGEGHEYVPQSPTNFESSFTPPARPAILTNGNKYYERSKPSYANIQASSFVSVRSFGAKGDGVTDDTNALQLVLLYATLTRKIVFFDAGTYKVTRTLIIPSGSRIVGESYPVIMSSGPLFANIYLPVPVVMVGSIYGSGTVEWSDMIVSTQGIQPGAILIQWNLASHTTNPSGMWDVHTRIGGFDGSNLQLAQCPTTPATPTVNKRCLAAYMSMHITSTGTGIHLENCWFWTADHDLDDRNSTQITIYTGRGLLVESTRGGIWLVGTAVEHHALYQYELANTENIWMGQIQTETAYWQPNPVASTPYPVNPFLNDPDLAAFCAHKTGNCNDGLGLRILNSANVLIYGAGLYSFFNNYSTSCSDKGNNETCQTRIFSLEGPRTSNVYVYNLNTIGATSMIDRDGVSLASYADNVNAFPDTIAYYRSN